MRLNLGAHMSIQGGIDRAPVRGHDLGCESIQIFTKSNMQWRARPLSDAEVDRFLARRRECRIRPILGHACYLLNLASPDDALWRRSVEAFALELERAERLALPLLISHPGAHLGAGEAAGLRRVAAAIAELVARTPDFRVALCLETTAGAGTVLGYRFEQLAEILAGLRPERRLGVCLDTAHTFAAGYDLRSEKGYRQTFAEFDRVIGLSRLRAIHLNDTQAGLASRVDRHEHIGRGTLGLEPFRRLMRDPRFRHLPKIIETPKGWKGRRQWDAINLGTLRRLAGAMTTRGPSRATP